MNGISESPPSSSGGVWIIDFCQGLHLSHSLSLCC